MKEPKEALTDSSADRVCRKYPPRPLKEETAASSSDTSTSAGAAVAGGMLLGPLGAAVGGAVRRRTVRRRDRFLVLGYGDAGEPTRFLIFQITQWGSRGREFVSAYKKRLGGAVTHVEL